MTRPTKENPVQSETDSTSRRHSRRQILALGGAAAAAAAVAAVGVNGGRKAQAHGTGQYGSNTPDPAIHAVNTADGMAIKAEAQSGHGVAGSSQTGWGMEASSQTSVGIVAASYSDSGWGALWAVAPGGAPAVTAISGLGPKGGLALDGELALAVVGKASFSTAGSGLVLAKSDAATVSDSAVTADSHITVTLTDDPGRASVAWVERHADTGFTVHMSSRPRSAVPFTYLIVEPGA